MTTEQQQEQCRIGRILINYGKGLLETEQSVDNLDYAVGVIYNMYKQLSNLRLELINREKINKR